MPDVEDFSALIGLWPSRSALADDCGVPYGHVKQWDRRNSIPPRHWPAVIQAAKRRGIPGITHERLTNLYVDDGGSRARAEGEDVA